MHTLPSIFAHFLIFDVKVCLRTSIEILLLVVFPLSYQTFVIFVLVYSCVEFYCLQRSFRPSYRLTIVKSNIFEKLNLVTTSCVGKVLTYQVIVYYCVRIVHAGDGYFSIFFSFLLNTHWTTKVTAIGTRQDIKHFSKPNIQNYFYGFWFSCWVALSFTMSYFVVMVRSSFCIFM